MYMTQLSLLNDNFYNASCYQDHEQKQKEMLQIKFIHWIKFIFLLYIKMKK